MLTFEPLALTVDRLAELRRWRDTKLPDVPVTYDVLDKTWRLLADYTIQIENTAKTRITAPAGFEYDLASIPRPAWWLIAPNELSLVAPLFHDLLYAYRGSLPVNLVAPWRSFTRLEADQLFLDLMDREGVSGWRQNAAYAAVRTFGRRWWPDGLN